MHIRDLKQHNRPARTAYRPKALPSGLLWLFVMILVFSWSLTGCQNDDFIWDLLLPTTSPAMTHSTLEAETTTGSESNRTEATNGSQSGETTMNGPSTFTTRPTNNRRDLSLPDAQFDKQVGELILKALQARQRTIVLDEIFQTYRVSETTVQTLIDAIFSIYGRVFAEHPEFFYMNGSFEVSYTLLHDSGAPGSGTTDNDTTGSSTTVSAMKLIPGFWPDTSQLNDKQLDALISQVRDETRLISDQIRQKTIDPIEQAILLHDWLIRSIEYDPQADQDHNTVHSALLDGITLCSGYARSFQMIGQALGLDIDLITGQSGGIGHAWNLITLDGHVFHVDVTHDDPLPDQGEAAPVNHRHLFRSDAQMSQTHQWQQADYPTCPEDGAFYYTRHDLVVASRKELASRLDEFLADIDFSRQDDHHLELLYTGDDVPSADRLQKILADALRDNVTGLSVVYRADSEKSVLVMEVTPQS